MRQLLAETAELLVRRGVQGRLYLVGGAAMVLAYDAERTTRDLDVLVLDSHGPITDAAREVGIKHGLPRTWLNEQASAFIPPGSDAGAVVVFDAPGLVVLAASPERMLVMKAHAARAADIDDIRQLVSLLGLTTVAEVDALVTNLMPDEPLSDRSRRVLEDVLD